MHWSDGMKIMTSLDGLQVAAKHGATAEVADCREDDAALIVSITPPASAAGCAPMEAASAVADSLAVGRGSGAAAAGSSGLQQLQKDDGGWQRLRMRVRLGYPQTPPVLLFPGPAEIDDALPPKVGAVLLLR